MRTVNMEIKIDSNSIRLDFCQIEGRTLNSASHFKFKNGGWVGVFNNFPVGDDNDLDILIIAVGNPGTDSKMTVSVDGIDKGSYNLYKPFNRNGYGQFNQEIS